MGLGARAIETLLLRRVHVAGALAAVFLLLSAAAVPAQDKSADACLNPVSQNELNACAAQEAEKADVEMALALARARKAMEAIDEDVSEARPNPAGGVEALELSQQGWLKYREGRCVIEGFDERGGSMEPMMVSQCKEEMARARIAELDEMAEE